MVVAATCLAYASSLQNAFLWDDLYLVVGNPAVKRWGNVSKLLTSDLFPGGIQSGYYRPLQAFTYLLDYQLWGLDPAGFHLTNTLLHAATAALLYRLGCVVLGDPRGALIAALVFAVHPIHVEAVAYVSGRSDPLSALCLLGAALWFLRGGKWIALSSAAFFLALLAREAAMVLPLLLVVLDVAVNPAGKRRGVLAYLPYAAALALYLALRAMAVGDPQATPATAAVPLGLRLLTMSKVALGYLGLLLVPVYLHMERSVPLVTSLFDPLAMASLAVIGLLSAGTVWAWRHARPLAFGVLWFFVALLPVSNVVPLATFMAEHWLYVPSMGLFLALGWLLGAVGRRRLALTIAGGVILVYGVATARRTLDWRDGRSLYEAMLPLAPHSVRLHVNLAQAYQEAGEVEKAREAYEHVIRFRPDDVDTANALNNLGNIHRQQGRLDAALEALDRALALNPRHIAAHNNRALTLQAMGRDADAERALEAVLAVDSNAATTHSNLGNMYFRQGQLERAQAEYLAALRLDPDYADAHNNLGSVYFRLGQPDLAEREYRAALRLDPRSEGARRNLAVVLDSRAGGGSGAPR